MNQPERDELRAKHHVGQNEAEDQCQACYSADGYPCDVIKMLDATEPVSKRVPNQCDNEHPQMSASASKSKKSSDPCNDDTHEPDESVFYTDIGWNYCPRCGVKL